ncbi:MAG: radical SAM protein [Pseudomonadota bacterium]
MPFDFGEAVSSCPPQSRPVIQECTNIIQTTALNDRSRIRAALIFPNTHRIGTANLGFQYLYGYLDSHDRYSVESFFLPPEPGSRSHSPAVPRSVETGRPLSEFQVIAFSVAFENDYPTIPALLVSAGSPPLQADRGPGRPVIIAGGGAVSMNPEPLADFVDLMFIGEAAEGSGADLFFSTLADALAPDGCGTRDRAEFLRLFSAVPHVYVPSAYRFAYSGTGEIEAVEVLPGFPEKVRAAKRKAGQGQIPMSVLFSPDSEFGDSLLIETNRGCSRGCRFCTAGRLHFPVRYARMNELTGPVDKALADGRNIGLVGSDLAGHPDFEAILEHITDRGGTFSLSSIRPEGLTDNVIRLMASVGSKTATLAPEAASARMKRVIGKEIPSERFIELIEKLVEAGIPNVRFYFMIGLPTETDDDIHEIVRFVKESRKAFTSASQPKGRIGRMGVQVNPFVPKPWTPFQWAAACPANILKKRIGILNKELRKLPNVVLRVESPREALRQAVLSRGDRRVGDLILRMAQQGGSRSGLLGRTAKEPPFYAFRERGRDETFPWDAVDHGLTKESLWKSRLLAVC